MTQRPHLILPRAEYNLPRKRTGFGSVPTRDFRAHGGKLTHDLGDVIASFRGRQRPTGIDPDLILRVHINPKSVIDEAEWDRCGLTLLSVNADRTLILFSSDSELSQFKERLAKYEQGPPPDQKGPPYQQIFSCIDGISDVQPRDRIGRLFRLEGVDSPQRFDPTKQYVVDVELWDLGSRSQNQDKVEELKAYIEAEAQGGRVSDSHVGESLVLVRVLCTGLVIRELLKVDSIATVDLPPKSTLATFELLDVGLEDLPRVPSPPEGSPGVAILDSGLSSAHPLISPAVGEATTAPRTWGDASDGHGHGTMVAGLALYGDVESCAASRSFVPRLTLYSARVLNDDCKFDDEHLITTQMREAIEYFSKTYGCRVFNASLGDDRLPYQGGKVSPWASILDTLARELDVVIVVSAGNYDYDPDRGHEGGHVTNYPRYLLDDAAKIIEPATGCIVVTVGALAHKRDVPPGAAGKSVAVRPIAGVDEPSPFTRCGPGLGGAIKPELCEVGGNHAYDGVMRKTRDYRELAVISLNRAYVERLFATDSGTSFAAPKVAHVAALLGESFPDASANLIRAFLAASATVPVAAAELLSPIDREAVLRLCGYGVPSIDVARTSDDSRVVLYAESVLEFDNFHIYQLPIPRAFVEEGGLRQITVTLAYDPPVRHTRFDYLGVKMSFRLIRGKTVDEIAEAFRQRKRDEAPVDRLTSSSFDCSMTPTATVREGGTLQKATFSMRKRPSTDYGDTYHIVVRCERKWARDEHGPQRYAVVASVEHAAVADLYNQIQARVQETVRVRTRQRTRA